eukprot:Lithocolla_globosa_v1_NODE_4457_length_1429_cov_171.279273.p2 type:complete len:127 gc:universal NODE_4457_length_1429_cov_171.279273:1124-744(-)
MTKEELETECQELKKKVEKLEQQLVGVSEAKEIAIRQQIAGVENRIAATENRLAAMQTQTPGQTKSTNPKLRKPTMNPPTKLESFQISLGCLMLDIFRESPQQSFGYSPLSWRSWPTADAVEKKTQ